MICDILFGVLIATILVVWLSSDWDEENNESN